MGVHDLEAVEPGGLGLDLGRAGYPHFYYLYKKIRVPGMLLEDTIAVIERC